MIYTQDHQVLNIDIYLCIYYIYLQKTSNAMTHVPCSLQTRDSLMYTFYQRDRESALLLSHIASNVYMGNRLQLSEHEADSLRMGMEKKKQCSVIGGKNLVKILNERKR